MDDDAPVTKERVYTWLGGYIELEIGDLEARVGFRGHLAVLAA